MTEDRLTTYQEAAALMERVIVQGDLAKLTPQDRVGYYRKTCETLGLNPFTRPFEYIVLNGKMTLYARKDATDQLRDIRHVSVPRLEREKMDGLYVVTAHAITADGREDSSIGAVSIEGLKGEHLANAIMKAETKAKRRVTLSICGLGWTDESEIDSIPDARPAHVNIETGEITEPESTPTAATTPPAGNGHDAPPAATGTPSRGDLLNTLDTRLKRITELDPKEYPKMWWTGHMKKHYGGLTSASALRDAQVLDYIAHCDGLIAKLSVIAPATVDDHHLPANL